MINAGSLNRRVTLRLPPSGQDAAGQPGTTWTDLVTVWANVRHPSGAEAMRADKDTSINQVRVRIRYRTDVTPAARVHDGAAVYQVKAVLPDLINKSFTDLVCEAVNG